MATKSFEINLTSACNFKCKYCIVKDYSGIPLVPDHDILRRYCDFVKYMKENHYKNDFIVVKFFGGEPFLYTDELTSLIPVLLRSVSLVTITTNGSLVEKNIDKLIKLKPLSDKIDIGVSFDFISQLENRDSSTYDDCLNGLEWLYHNNFCNTVLSVITPSTIEHIDELFLEFVKIKDYLPRLTLRYTLDKTVEFDNIDKNKVRTAMANINSFIKDNPRYKTSFLPNGSCGTMCELDHDCFFGNSVISIDAHDGSLYPGYNLKYQPKHITEMFYIGNINDEFSEIDIARKNLIEKINRKVNPECVGCNAICCYFPWYGNIITRLEDYNRMPAESHCKIHKLIAEYL